MISDSEILEIVQQSATLQEAVDQLIEAAKENGGEDNVTVILVRLVSEKHDPSADNA